MLVARLVKLREFRIYFAAQLLEIFVRVDDIEGRLFACLEQVPDVLFLFLVISLFFLNGVLVETVVRFFEATHFNIDCVNPDRLI